jgi:FKBP-type peptidyl-prolyl cis-trans isomerase (trigger factor)
MRKKSAAFPRSRAKDSLARVSRLEGALENISSIAFSHQYVSKIADKVARETLVQADRTQIEQRMNFTRENYRMMREELLKIVLRTLPRPQQVARAGSHEVAERRHDGPSASQRLDRQRHV